MTDELQPAEAGTEADFAARKKRGDPGFDVANTSRMGAMLWIGLYTFLLNIVTLTMDDPAGSANTLHVAFKEALGRRDAAQ